MIMPVSTVIRKASWPAYWLGSFGMVVGMTGFILAIFSYWPHVTSHTDPRAGPFAVRPHGPQNTTQRLIALMQLVSGESASPYYATALEYLHKIESVITSGSDPNKEELTTLRKSLETTLGDMISEEVVDAEAEAVIVYGIQLCDASTGDDRSWDSIGMLRDYAAANRLLLTDFGPAIRLYGAEADSRTRSLGDAINRYELMRAERTSFELYVVAPEAKRLEVFAKVVDERLDALKLKQLEPVVWIFHSKKEEAPYVSAIADQLRKAGIANVVDKGKSTSVFYEPVIFHRIMPLVGDRVFRGIMEPYLENAQLIFQFYGYSGQEWITDTFEANPDLSFLILLHEGIR